MVLRDSPASPTVLAPPTASGRERHAELVSLDVSTIGEIVDYIVSARQRGSESLLGFHWQPSQACDLSDQLDARLVERDQPKIGRFEYDYESETVYLDIMGESMLHYMVRIGVRDHITNHLAKLLATTNDPMIRDSESRHHVERKAHQYINSSDGKIRVVLVLDLQYPDPKKAWVSLLVADDSSSDWVQRSELFYDESGQQPVGQVDLYLSDFLGLASLPAAFCRPSATELASGTPGNPTITLTYERLRAIFCRARHLHDPTKFPAEVGDEESPYENAERRAAEAERRVVEVRNEMERRKSEERIETERRMERRVAEARIEMEQRMAAEMERRVAAEMERRVAAEMERRMAEGGLEAE
ncbi:hypothetical protein C8A00DRAFT_40532 [Chaetomidium leptoderma]|uniref:Uncharacterized protein n=1 Tax=Chaetomidium leptoderma TaxID=669021 RepID=A0AAN6VV38_9PEZI|nr:hypothetical protein C8A00DRAFT_40532 [Chaetomidium leptoderma]